MDVLGLQADNKYADLVVAPDSFCPPPPHFAAIHHLQYGLATREQFDAYFKFAFVRNPWDRVVSEYHYRRHARLYSFKEFLFEHFPRPSWADAWCHVIPQYDFLYDANGKRLVDFVGRYERLAADFEHVCKVLSLSTTKLPHKNKSNSILFRRDNNPLEVLRTLRSNLSLKRRRNTFEHYTQYYDDECIEWVRTKYQKDIDTFEYRFGD